MAEATWLDEAKKNSGFLIFLGILTVIFGIVAAIALFVAGSVDIVLALRKAIAEADVGDRLIPAVSIHPNDPERIEKLRRYAEGPRPSASSARPIGTSPNGLSPESSWSATMLSDRVASITCLACGS